MVITNAPIFISFVLSVTFASLTLGISIGSRLTQQKRAFIPLSS